MAKVKAGRPTRAEVEAAITEAMGKMGQGGIDRHALATALIARGMSKPTAYRWIKKILAKGRPGAAIEAKVVKARAERTPEPARDAAQEIVALIPPAVTMGDLTGDDGTIAVVSRITAVLRDMDLLVAHAKHDDGKVKNSKLLLAASREMRQGLETAMKLKEGMRQERDLDEMMRAIVAEVAKESPGCAERILHRMTGVLTLHGV